MKLIARGSTCTCSPDRYVRHAIPPVPGIPLGEVSCRPHDSAKHADVRYHALAPGWTVAVQIPVLA